MFNSIKRKQIAVSLVAGAALLSQGCATIGGENLSLGFQKADAGYAEFSSAEVVPTLQWQINLDGPRVTSLNVRKVNASEQAQAKNNDDQMMWTWILVGAGVIYIASKQERNKNSLVCTGTTVPYGVVIC